MGCDDPKADNYYYKDSEVDENDRGTIYNDGSCIYKGCTNIDSSNYIPYANVDDGSCKHVSYSSKRDFLLLNKKKQIKCCLDKQTSVEEQINDICINNIQSFSLKTTGQDYFGGSVDMSTDGNIIVVGAPEFDDSSQSEYARVYEWNGGYWKNRGSYLAGNRSSDDPNSQFGSSVAINGDGSIVAVGAHLDGTTNKGSVFIFKLNEVNSYTQITSYSGENDNDEFGRSIALSKTNQDTDTYLIVGAWKAGTNDSGIVYIYKIDANQNIIATIPCPDTSSAMGFGRSVSVNNDGTVFAIGAPNTNGVGFVEVYFRTDETFGQIGPIIQGTGEQDYFGMVISLSGNGYTIAISAHLDDDNGSNSGTCKVYTWINNSWVQKGNLIKGTGSNNQFSRSLVISDDGNYLLIGAPLQTDKRGVVKLFYYNYTTDTWDMIKEILGESTNDEFGHALTMNSDASKFAITSIKYNENRGLVNIYHADIGICNEENEQM